MEADFFAFASGVLTAALSASFVPGNECQRFTASDMRLRRSGERYVARILSICGIGLPFFASDIFRRVAMENCRFAKVRACRARNSGAAHARLIPAHICARLTGSAHWLRAAALLTSLAAFLMRDISAMVAAECLSPRIP